MSDQLELTCSTPNKRPSVTDEMRQKACREVALRLVRTGTVDPEDVDGAVVDLMKATRSERHDGFKIARELERYCHWDCDMQIAEEMDAFDGILEREREAAEKRWAAENPVTPAFADGAAVTWRGEPATVAGIYEYRPHCYRLITAESKPGSAFIVPFEDVVAGTTAVS